MELKSVCESLGFGEKLVFLQKNTLVDVSKRKGIQSQSSWKSWSFQNEQLTARILRRLLENMPKLNPTDAQLLAYLDEMLPIDQSAIVEQALREHADVRTRAALLARRRDQGGHTVGEIWMRQRLSCLSRSQLGSYLLGVADPNLEDYILFHIDVVGCRFCQANIEDLRASQQPSGQDERQRRYFESSAGLLRSRHNDE